MTSVPDLGGIVPHTRTSLAPSVPERRESRDVAALVAARTGAGYAPPGAQPKTFTRATPDGQRVSVTMDTSVVSPAVAQQRIEAQLAAAAARVAAAGRVESTLAAEGRWIQEVVGHGSASSG